MQGSTLLKRNESRVDFMGNSYKPHKSNGGGYYSYSIGIKIARAVLIPLFALLILLSALFCGYNLNARAYSSIPSGTVANIYDKSKGQFNRTNLDDLAVKSGYTDFTTMVAAAENSATALKKGVDFGTITVNFGSYATKTGGSADLTWAPIYLSRDDDGNAILTLWLASSESANTSSDQEVSSFSDGTQTASNVNPNSNNYGTSYMRAVTLNIGGQYATAYSGSRAPTMVTATPTTTNKFADFTVGDLRQFLTVPNKVAVQRSIASDRGDLSFRGSNYTNNWGDDPIWLPSRTEITGVATVPTIFNPSNNQKANTINTWFRTGGSGSYYDVIYMYRTGVYSSSNYFTNASTVNGVRPALHLNLSKIAGEEFMPVPAATGSYTYNGSAQSISLNSDFQSDKMEITNIERSGGTATVAPTYTATSVSATDAGTYTVTVKAKDYVKDGQTLTYQWITGDVTDKERTFTFTVDRAKLNVPNFGAGNTNTQVYDGTLKTFTASNPLPTALTNYPLTATVTRTGGAPNTAPTQTDNGGTLGVSVRDAGAYTASFAIKDTANYEWSDGTQSSKSAGFTVNKAPLTLRPTATTTGGVWNWSADSVNESATLTASGFFDGNADFPADNVGIRMEITDTNGTSQYTGTYSGGTYTFTINAALFGGSYSPGTYAVKLVFTGGTHDGNYDLDSAMSALGTLQLVIGASVAGLPSYDFQIRENVGSSLGAWAPIAANGSVPYTGNTYEIAVIQTGFAAANIEIDDSSDRQAQGFVNGYKNESAINAGTYTTRVAIKVTDPSQYAFADGSTTTEITFTWTIDKATISGGFKWQYTDANGVVQTYDPATATDSLKIPWKGSNYTLTLTDLPSGVTVNPGNSYNGNAAKGVGSYTATCTSLNYDTTNYNAIPTPTLNWEIVALEVEINSASWITDAQTSASGVFFLPHLNSPYDGTGIVYEYYYFGTSSGAGDYTTATKLSGISDIEYTEGTTRYYCVLAKLSGDISTDGVTPWNQALVLKDTTSPPNGDYTMAFTTGSNRTPVSVTLSGNPFIYNGKPHGELNKDLFVKVGSNDFAASNFDIRYYTKDDYDAHVSDPENRTPLSGAPVNAGEYVIVVGLSGSAADDYFLNASVFNMTVEKYVFDLSGLQWGYLDGDGNEVVYNPSSPLQYELDENGDPVTHTLQFIGFPKGDANGDKDAQLLAEMFAQSGLAGFFGYTNNTANAVTGTTPNRAEYTFTPDAAFGVNFDVTGMPANTPFEWRVDVKKIAKPQDDNSKTFDGEAIDLLGLAGLDAAGLGKYYNITAVILITPGGDPKTLSVSDIGTYKDAGEYRLTAQLTDAVNMRWDDNGILKTAAQQFRITVGVLEIMVSDWEGDGKEPYTPIFNNGTGEVPNVWRNLFVDSHGNTITDDSWKDMYGETFKQVLAATEGNEENVRFVYPEGVDEEKTFTLIDPSEISLPVKRPEFTGTVGEDGVKSEVYTGAPQDFLPQNLQELIDKGRVKLFAVDEEGNETEVDGSYFTQTNAGKYTVRARLQSPYVWSDTEDRAPIDFTFEVKPAKVTPVWKTDKDGKPVASLPAGFESLGNVFDYHYYDADGNEVAEKDLKGGEEYSVGVSVKDEYKENFVLTNKDGSMSSDGIVVSEETFTQPESGFMGFMTKSALFGLPMWLWLVIIIIALILLILLIILIAKKRKKKKEEKEKSAEKQEEKDRAEAEKREREEEKRRKEEEREEEKRRKEEERQEEKRRKEEEREEEKRRREEEREEEKRRREDRLEEERRRREDEQLRREEIAAMNAMGGKVGMNGMGAAQGMNNVNGMGGMANNMGMPQQPYMPQMPVPPQMPPQYAQSQYPQTPQYAPQTPVQVQSQPQTVYIDRGNDGEAYSLLHEYEARLRTLERELEEKRIESIRNKEHARAQEEMRAMQEQQRRDEELQRLRMLQEEESRRLQEEEARYRKRYDVAREMRERRRELEEERLRALEEQIRRKEADNRALEARFRETYAPYPQEIIRYGSSDDRNFDPNIRR